MRSLAAKAHCGASEGILDSPSLKESGSGAAEEEGGGGEEDVMVDTYCVEGGGRLSKVMTCWTEGENILGLMNSRCLSAGQKAREKLAVVSP